MTFLLFLASVAVLEYILSRDRPSAQSPPPPPKKEAASAGLVSLAQIVEQQGAGPAPAQREAKPVAQVPDLHS